MAGNGISLNDKTVVLAGPFGLLTQSLTQAFTECGADVALLTDDIKGAQRFCQNVSDLREMSERYGRAAALEVKIGDAKEAEIAFGRCAELFGTIDIYVDTQFYSARIPFQGHDATVTEQTLTGLDKTLQTVFDLSAAALAFLRGRTKTRVIYVFNELDLVVLEKAKAAHLTKMLDFMRKTASDTIKDHITFNAVAVGVSEEFLLHRFKNSPSIQASLKQLQATLPLARLVEYRDISNTLTFLASPLSAALNGQVLRLNHGLV